MQNMSMEVKNIIKLSAEQKGRFQEQMVCKRCEKAIKNMEEDWYIVSALLKGSNPLITVFFLCKDCYDKINMKVEV